MAINTKRCLVCQRPRDTVYFHKDPETGALWLFCKGKCQRGYSLYAYCTAAGVTVSEFLKNEIIFKESEPNQVTKQEWPRNFIPMSDPRSQQGIDYIQNERGINPGDGMYYDVNRNGIVFPYFFHDVFVGAQTRFIEPYLDKEGNTRKVDTMPGSRLGLIFYNWNQAPLMANIKGVVVVEGAFDVQALQQAFNAAYGGPINCPWRVIACSGSGVTKHQIEKLQELVQRGYKVILGPDSDEAGFKMKNKLKAAGACTHVAFTGVKGWDWNDAWKEIANPKEYIKWFLGKVTNV